jgi:hypothetical protein
MQTRRCPSCGELKSYNEHDGGRDFYTRKNVWREVDDLDDSTIRVREHIERIPSAYCRACTNKKRSESRRRAKVRDLICRAADGSQDTAFLTGACHVCGHVGKYTHSGYGLGLVCWACRTLLGDLKDRKGRLLAVLQVLLAHNAGRYQASRPKTVVKRKLIRGVWEEWDEPAPDGGHKFGTITDHEVCLAMEARVRTLLAKTLRPAA